MRREVPSRLGTPEATAGPGDNPLYHPVSSRPPLPSRAGDQALGAELVFGPGGQPLPDAGIAAELFARARAVLPVLDDIEPAPRRPCLRTTRSDRPDRSAKPAGAGSASAASSGHDGSAPGCNVAAGLRRVTRSGPVRRGKPRPRRRRCGPGCPGRDRTGESCGDPCARRSPARRAGSRQRRGRR